MSSGRTSGRRKRYVSSSFILAVLFFLHRRKHVKRRTRPRRPASSVLSSKTMTNDSIKNEVVSTKVRKERSEQRKQMTLKENSPRHQATNGDEKGGDFTFYRHPMRDGTTNSKRRKSSDGQQPANQQEKVNNLKKAHPLSCTLTFRCSRARINKEFHVGPLSVRPAASSVTNNKHEGSSSVFKLLTLKGYHFSQVFALLISIGLVNVTTAFPAVFDRSSLDHLIIPYEDDVPFQRPVNADDEPYVRRLKL